jgi:hypothetical protein
MPSLAVPAARAPRVPASRGAAPGLSTTRIPALLLLRSTAHRGMPALAAPDGLLLTLTPGRNLAPEFAQQYRAYFAGETPCFTDSSDTEKHEFQKKLTFPHPERPGETLFCPWHGKVKVQQIRVHCSYPIRRDEPLYIVYIGPKITRR